jgi:hypothetical protein
VRHDLLKKLFERLSDASEIFVIRRYLAGRPDSVLTSDVSAYFRDGTEEEFGPGDVGVTPPGYDAWVVGNEAVVVIDISGMKEYAKPKAKRTARKS